MIDAIITHDPTMDTLQSWQKHLAQSKEIQ